MNGPLASAAAFLALAGIAVAAAACSRSSQSSVRAPRPQPTCEAPAPEREPETNAKLAPYAGPMVVVQPTKMEAEIRAAGLDPRNLPSFETIDNRTKRRLMKTFATSLGLRCVGCHDPNDFSKPSPRKRAVVRMWNDFVRVLATEDGSPIYCDSCHQGSVLTLDRRDKALVSSFMDDVFVGKLKRRDGADHDCGTCHGDPPDFAFLEVWRGQTP
jgi:hypothetical protein